MAKFNEVFPSKYLKAEEDVVEGKDRTLTIKRVDIEDFEDNGRKTKKPVLFFKGEAKGMVCNKTNSKTLAEIYGDDTDDWEGKPIVVCSTEVQFGDEMVYSIRIVKKKTIAARDAKPPAKVTQADADEASAEHAARMTGEDDAPPF